MAIQKIFPQQIDTTGGTPGQVLVANSTGVTWGDANNTAFVGSVSAANVVSNAQLSANLANYTTTVGLSSYQTTAGLSGNVATLTANNTSFVGSVSAANVVSNSQLSSNLANYVNTSGAYTISGVHTHTANIILGSTTGISANSSYGSANQVLTSNGSVVYWSTVTSGGGGFTNGQSISVANLGITGAVYANGASNTGTAGQVLTTNGTGVYWSSVSATPNALSQSFSGDGTTTNFTLNTSVASQNNIIVTMNGLVQVPVTHYTISGTTLSFTSAPYSSATIEARNFENGTGGGGGGSATISSGDLFLGVMLLGGM